jgi:hypothetical protein
VLNNNYQRFRSGVVTESGACGFDIRWKFRFISRLFRWRGVFLWDDVVDGLLHLTSLFINK